jgi:hypothetical protein
MKQKKTFALLFIAALIVFNFGCDQQQEKEEATETVNTTTNQAVNQPQKITADKKLLAGDWTRTDAPYQIKISELSEGGNMKVGYFNPKSINVGKANWSSTDGFLKIYIELRDENYPGSNYTLIYYPDKDLLAGKYYQAVEAATYEVGFMRKK